MEIRLDSVIERTENVVEAEVDGEMVMMSVESGTYYGINTVGKRIWEQLVEPKTVATICEQLKDEFEIDSVTCENEVMTFLNSLKNDELIQIKKM